eukprot:EG_transcript_6937
MVYVVGTAHVSSQSLRDVRRTIRLVRPQAVMVELCASRAVMLDTAKADEVSDDDDDGASPKQGAEPQQSLAASHSPSRPRLASVWAVARGTALLTLGWLWWLLSLGLWLRYGSPDLSLTSRNLVAWLALAIAVTGALRTAVSNGYLLFAAPYLRVRPGDGPAVWGVAADAVRQWRAGGQSAESFFRTFLALYFAKVSQDLHIEVGAEFRTAIAEAKKLQATIILGDRPARVTLRRLWAALTSLQKARLVCQLTWELCGTHTEAMVEELKAPAHLEDMMNNVRDAFPSLSSVLVTERDRWMAQQLFKAQEDLQPHQSETGAAAIVAVVGMGHKKGIAKVWDDLIQHGAHLDGPSAELPDPSPPPEQRLLDNALLGIAGLLAAAWLLDAPVLHVAVYGPLLAMAAYAAERLGWGWRGSPAHRTRPTQAEVHQLLAPYLPALRKRIDHLAERWALVLAWENPAASLQVLVGIFIVGEVLGHLNTYTAACVVTFGGLLYRFFRPEALHAARWTSTVLNAHPLAGRWLPPSLLPGLRSRT